MITNVSVRPYRPTSAVPVSRRQVRRSAQTPSISASLKRQVAGVVGAAVLAVLGISQVFSWQSGRLEDVFSTDQQVKNNLTSENIALRAKRAQLISKSHVQAVAGVRLELFPPAGNQVHKM